MVNIPLAQLVHARIALQVEEVRLEVTMLITTRLRTAPYVSLENILKMVITRLDQRLVSYVHSDDFRRRLYSANAPFAPLEDIVHKLGEQQAIPTPTQAAQSV